MKGFERPTFEQEYEMKIPQEVQKVNEKLAEAGFQAYLVGGCVRDFLLDKKPKDWDLTTNAAPEKIQEIFADFTPNEKGKPSTVYENKFGTVAVKTGSEDPTLALVEVTTYRKEGKYTDKRHPDEITFAKTVEEDLSRRDFTVNALAMDAETQKIVDPFGGREDLKNKIIRAVGEPAERFQEDALRLMRAVRFAGQLGFQIEKKTAKAIKENAGLLEFIAKERIADEFSKLLMTENAHDGVRQMQELGLLKYAVPELEEGVDMEQNKHHIYSVFEHNVKSLEYAVKENFPLPLRLASLFHDVGKSRVRKWKNDPRGEKTFRGKKGDWTFYQHQHIGEKMVLEILDRLHFPKAMTEKIALLVKEHMFVYDPEVVTERGVRRLVRRVGSENIDDLIKLREADRIGSGVPKAQPYRLRHLQAMIEKAKKDPVSVKMLKIRGDEVMKMLGIEPGPKVGQILDALLEEALNDPSLNEKEKLAERVEKLGKLSEKELQAMREKAKKTATETQERIDNEIKKKYFVK